MNNRTSLTETEHKVIHNLKQRGEDRDTVIAIFKICLKTASDTESYLAWLESHPDADQDTLFEYALTEYGHVQLPE